MPMEVQIFCQGEILSMTTFLATSFRKIPPGIYADLMRVIRFRRGFQMLLRKFWNDGITGTQNIISENHVSQHVIPKIPLGIYLDLPHMIRICRWRFQIFWQNSRMTTFLTSFRKPPGICAESPAAMTAPSPNTLSHAPKFALLKS